MKKPPVPTATTQSPVDFCKLVQIPAEKYHSLKEQLSFTSATIISRLLKEDYTPLRQTLSMKQGTAIHTAAETYLQTGKLTTTANKIKPREDFEVHNNKIYCTPARRIQTDSALKSLYAYLSAHKPQKQHYVESSVFIPRYVMKNLSIHRALVKMQSQGIAARADLLEYQPNRITDWKTTALKTPRAILREIKDEYLVQAYLYSHIYSQVLQEDFNTFRFVFLCKSPSPSPPYVVDIDMTNQKILSFVEEELDKLTRLMENKVAFETGKPLHLGFNIDETYY